MGPRFFSFVFAVSEDFSGFILFKTEGTKTAITLATIVYIFKLMYTSTYGIVVTGWWHSLLPFTLYTTLYICLCVSYVCIPDKKCKRLLYV